jgi:hypothetical protein
MTTEGRARLPIISMRTLVCEHHQGSLSIQDTLELLPIVTRTRFMMYSCKKYKRVNVEV